MNSGLVMGHNGVTTYDPGRDQRKMVCTVIYSEKGLLAHFRLTASDNQDAARKAASRLSGFLSPIIIGISNSLLELIPHCADEIQSRSQARLD